MSFYFPSLRGGVASVAIQKKRKQGWIASPLARNDEFVDGFIKNKWMPAYAGMTRIKMQ